MTTDRYVVLGLAAPRATWSRDVTRWSVSAALPVELVRCVSVEDLRAHLASGRTWSAVLVDGGVLGVDVDLLGESDAPVIVVADERTGRDWRALGAAAVLPSSPTRDELLEVLVACASPVGAPLLVKASFDPGAGRAPLAVVIGPGGTGVTTTAAALAQGVAPRRHVLLADLALQAEQGVLHDVGDVAPGLQELVEAHRSHAATAATVRSVTFDVPDRGYHLLLGLRHPRQWSTLRPRAVAAAIDALRQSFGIVVADVSGDLDGSTSDLADRNALARAAVDAADVVLAVGRPTTKGVHALVRLLADLDPVRTIPVLACAPRHPRQRAELAGTVGVLAGTQNAPLFLPTRRVDQAWRDATPIPAPLPELAAGAFEALYGRLGPAGFEAPDEPTRVVPGSLGVA